jgi:hypothetical protein
MASVEASDRRDGTVLPAIARSRCTAIGALLAALAAATCPALSVAEDTSTWYRGSVPVRLAAPDLSFLNHRPAGQRGRVQRQGSELVFEDGTPARFWGVNLQAYALFATDPANIPVHARRLASLGVNLVRIHHHDSAWVNPNVFDPAFGTRRLRTDSLVRLDQWIASLRAEGIYIWLDLHVGRQLLPEDEIADFEEIRDDRGRADLRGFNYISPSIQARMREFQVDYLSHVNRYTGLAYAEDPAIMAVLITNENDLTHHFGNRLLPDKEVPEHTAVYLDLAKAFAAEHGLNPGQVWRSWEHGPSKLFLNDLERRFNALMQESIRDTGYDGLIATTNTWGGMSLAGLPSLTTGDLIDVHSYGAPGQLRVNPHEQADLLSWIAAAQVAGFPLSISEWNLSPYPAEDRFIAPLRVAVSGAHQGWDAPLIYGYAQQPLNAPFRPDNWNFAYDPALVAMMPAAALLFRRGDVQPATTTYRVDLDREAFFGRAITPETSIALRTIPEQGRLVIGLPEVPELPWLEATAPDPDVIRVTDPDMSLLPEGATEVIADTGEFGRDFVHGLFTVDTARTQIAAGSFPDAPLRLSAIELHLDNAMAAVAVQSLDDLPLGQSREILISLTARAVPLDETSPTFLLEPVNGTLRVPGPGTSSLSRLGIPARSSPRRTFCEMGSMRSISQGSRARTGFC